MEAKLQRRIQRYGWDKAVSHYEGYWQRQIAPAQTHLLEMMALQPGERVLDVACGTGLLTFPAAEAVGAEGLVVGTDISEGMVEAGRKEALRRGLENVSFARADAEDMVYPECSFEAALCSLGLMYVPDPVNALRQMQRMLRPGGRVGVAVWGQRERCGWAGIFPVVDARVKSEVCPMFFQLGTGEAMRRAMEMAGFVEIRLERLCPALHYESAEDAVGAAFAGGPVALAYHHFDQRTREEAEQEYLASIAPFRRGEGYSIPGEFVVAVGRRD